MPPPALTKGTNDELREEVQALHLQQLGGSTPPKSRLQGWVTFASPLCPTRASYEGKGISVNTT